MRTNINLKQYQCRYCDYRIPFEKEAIKVEALPDPGWIVDDICAETTSQIKCEEVSKYYLAPWKDATPREVSVKWAKFAQHRLSTIGEKLRNRICQDESLSKMLKR